MWKWCKALLAVAFLPACAGGAQALWRVLRASGDADTTWVPLLAGATCWMVIFWLLPKPMWVYVFGHELTHAIWAWLSGGTVKEFRASAEGGHVVVTKSNFLIALAPYFFPLYAVLSAGIYAAGERLWGWAAYAPWFHLLVGAAYAFHVTLTWHVLQTRQTDITQQGYLFSAVVIFLGNVGALLVAIPLLTSRVGVWTAMKWWADATWGLVGHWGRHF
jgi:hypothetical protein